MRCYFAEASGMEDVSVVTLSGQYESSCGYCGSEEGTSVAFGMTAKTITDQARLLFLPADIKDSWLSQSRERASLYPHARLEMQRIKHAILRSVCEKTISANNMGHGLVMQSQVYQDLLDRGWRRSGTWLYLPLYNKTCCPCYTHRLDVLKFAPNKVFPISVPHPLKSSPALHILNICCHSTSGLSLDSCFFPWKADLLRG